MNILSFNICGYDFLAKKRKLKYLISEGSFKVCLIQETKIQKMEDKGIWSLWGGSEVEWTSKPSQGKFGGLQTMWKASLFNLIFSFKGEGYVGVDAARKVFSIYLVNIYSSYYIHEKREFWKDLSDSKRRMPNDERCIVKDINAI